MPQKLCDEPLPFLLLGQVGHGDFSGYLRCPQASATRSRRIADEVFWIEADQSTTSPAFMDKADIVDLLDARDVGPPFTSPTKVVINEITTINLQTAPAIDHVNNGGKQSRPSDSKRRKCMAQRLTRYLQ